MGDSVNFPVPLGDDVSPELVADLVRFAEGLLSEKFIRMKYRFDEATWESLGSNDALVEKIETEKIRRMRNGETKREKAQLEIVDAPPILGGIMRDPNANERHKIDSIKALDALAANGPESAPAADRFIITINLGEDVLRFNKSIAINPNDVDPDNTDATPQVPLAAITRKTSDDDDGGQGYL